MGRLGSTERTTSGGAPAGARRGRRRVLRQVSPATTFRDLFPGAPASKRLTVKVTSEHIEQGGMVQMAGVLNPQDNPVALAISEALGQPPGAVEAYEGRWSRYQEDPDDAASEIAFELPDHVRIWLECWHNYDKHYCTPCDFLITLRPY